MISLDSKRQIAAKLQLFSVKSLELNELPKRYISLTVGTTPHKNAITISEAQDRVSFYVENHKLLEDLRGSGFRFELTNQGYGYNKSRYWVYKVGLDDIERHAALFKNLVIEAVEVMIGRRTKNQ